VTIVRLAIGAAGLGSAQVVQGTRARSPAGNGQARRQPGPFGVGDLVAGLAVVSAEMVDRLASRAGRLGPVPLVSPPVRRLCGRGRDEQQRGRRLVEQLIRDTTVGSMTDIAKLAVNEVAHSPEVAALVKTQSAGIATDAILEVRANSEQADDRLERRVRSWLHLRGSNGAAKRSAVAVAARPDPGA